MQMETKKAEVPILISDKTHFEIKELKRDKRKRYYIIIKGSIQEEDIAIKIYMYLK